MRNQWERLLLKDPKSQEDGRPTEDGAEQGQREEPSSSTDPVNLAPAYSGDDSSDPYYDKWRGPTSKPRTSSQCFDWLSCAGDEIWKGLVENAPI